jgi:hypothetical protein
MSNGERVRLCSVILSAYYYVGKMEVFLPDEDFVDQNCYYKVLKVHNSTSVTEKEVGTIVCKTINHLSRQPATTYYVSAGFSPYDDFIRVGPGRKKTLVGGVNRRLGLRVQPLWW